MDVAVDEVWTRGAAPRIVADAALLHRRVGTAGGIRDALRLAAGPEATVEVQESGGTSWSTDPGAPLPGSDAAGVVISITVPSGDVKDLARRFERVAAGVVPAHVPMRLTVTVVKAAE